MSIPSYIPIPPSARPIPTPNESETSTTRRKSSVSPSPSPAQPSFPPTAFQSTSTAGPSRKFSIPAPSLSTNVSDLLLSSLLPTNLPKLPTATSASKGGPGRPRELNTQREGLRLDIMSNNFRRFITKVGPVFWLQDRMEEVLFWRKPLWTWAWIMIWAFISFQPRVLLLIPSLTLILILLHLSELRKPLPSLLGGSIPTPSASTLRTTGTKVDADGGPVSLSTGPDGEPLPVVPPKETESGVDYYMNLQAIQNTMGWVSDAYDEVYPILNATLYPSKIPTTLPLTPTHLLLALLPPSLLLPLTPGYLIPYLLLPVGWGPPLVFHPNLVPFLSSLPTHPMFRQIKAVVTRLMLTDALPDDIGRSTIKEVEVWENERLDPAVTMKTHPANPVPAGSWSQRFLRAGERMPWVKIRDEGAVWAGPVQGEADGEGPKVGSRNVPDLREGWKWIPGEEWRVDVSGLWSEVGVDADGWVYSDDSWQSLAPSSLPAAEVDSPVPAMRRATRRRKWWRRVYLVQDETP